MEREMRRRRSSCRLARWLAGTAAACALASPADAQPPRSSTITVAQSGPVTTATASIGGPAAPAFAPNRLIVRFRNGADFLPGSGRSVALSARLNIHLVDNPAGVSVVQGIARYRANPNVVYAEPDFTVRAIDTFPNDTNFNSTTQWDMYKISAPTAWDTHTDSSSVVVAIVDTGIDYTHPDLVANIWNDPSNASVHGRTCMNGACTSTVGSGFDDHGHGTHVAGTIGAATNNATGMAGINWHVQLMAVKFLNSGGSGSISDAVLAFDLLKTMKNDVTHPLNVRVTNNSWGGGGFSQALKDSMAALETGTPSTLDVCAAGNSAVNADFTPMYPAAYDNRGIVSVLATDVNDFGASFTNYGLASVDIAAPGVNTYSTESMGSCSLCDPSGYRTLSGTSMATPHVTGAAAALLSMYPALKADEARDVLLNPGSYDVMSEAKAAMTSTGGRLNVARTITNAMLKNPITLNKFPTVSVGPDAFVTAGQQVNFTSTASDPDAGQTLRTLTGRGAASAGSTWLFGWELNLLFPNSLPFNAPAVARDAAMNYDTSVADNYGGGASGRTWAVVSKAAGAGGPPTGTLTVPATGSVNVAVPITFNGSDPQKLPIAWDLWASGVSSSSGICCYTGTSTSLTFSQPGVYRVAVQAIDQELNVMDPQTAVISIGGAVGTPPTAAAVLDKESGPVPLTVNIDMSASTGAIKYYFIGCGGGFTVGSGTATGSCQFTTPGTYWLLLQVQDTANQMALISKYVVALPAGGAPPPPDITPPTVSITTPPASASLTGTVALTANAADNAGGSGVKEVEYYLDSTSQSASLGKATTAPYTVSWNSSALSATTHTIYAIARDNAGNPSIAVSVNITKVAPTLGLASSATTVSKKGSATLTATPGNTPTYPSGIARVDFLIGTTVVCSDTTPSPYSCSWKAPAAPKTYQAQAKAYDSRGLLVSSNTVAIVVK
jgi:subtilisin family serine protease